MPRSALLLAALAAAGCHTLLPFGAASDRAAIPAEGGTVDRAAEVGVLDGSQGSRESLPSLPLRCKGLAQVGTGYPLKGLSEPAVEPTGLGLVAGVNGTFYRSARVNLGAPFGPWSLATNLPTGYFDPTFFQWQGSTHLMVATDGGTASEPLPRKIVLCPLPIAACSDLDIVLLGLAQPLDLDGPSVIGTRDSPLVLTFNVQTAWATVEDQKTAEIYLASSGTLAGPWSAKPLPGVNAPNRKEDDPALSPDGSLIVLDIEQQLYSSRRAGDAFSTPVPIDTPDWDGKGSAPALFDAGTLGLELYFSKVDSNVGAGRIYRSVCTP